MNFDHHPRDFPSFQALQTFLLLALLRERVELVDDHLFSAEAAMDPLSLPARDFMNPHPCPLDKGPLGRDLAWQFLSGWFNGWPVINDEKQVIGMVTDWNLLVAVCAGRDLAAMLVEDLMTVPPVVVREHDPLRSVLERMVAERLLKIAVTDEAQRLVGLITRAELVDAVTVPSAPSSRRYSACAWCERIKMAEGLEEQSQWLVCAHFQVLGNEYLRRSPLFQRSVRNA